MSNRCLCTLLMILLAALALHRDARAEQSDGTLARITVETGEHRRVDTPVSVGLPDGAQAWRPLRLVEQSDGGERAVPVQIEPGDGTDDPPRLWFVLDGETPAGTARRFELRRGPAPEAPSVRMGMADGALDVSYRGQRVFRYNHRHVVPPEGIPSSFIRSGYIHPLFNPAGQLITEDFPSDHYHHKGIWFTWPNTRYEGRDIDFWNLAEENGTVQFAGYGPVRGGPVFGRFVTRHQFVDLTQPDGGKVAVRERWDVRVYAVGGPERGVWLFDITSSQRAASDSPLTLPAYRYGGMAYRGPKQWKNENYKVLTSEGLPREEAHATRAKWAAHSGSIDGRWTTVVAMCHPDNERFPEPMRIWEDGHGAFFNWVPRQKRDLVITSDEREVFRYRFFVHDGRIDDERAERGWQDFANPPRVTYEPAD